MNLEHESNEESNEKIVDQALKILQGAFDSAAIFVTYTLPDKPDNTYSIHKCSGNFFARYGQTKEWVISEEERMRQEARNQE